METREIKRLLIAYLKDNDVYYKEKDINIHKSGNRTYIRLSGLEEIRVTIAEIRGKDIADNYTLKVYLNREVEIITTNKYRYPYSTAIFNLANLLTERMF